MNNIFLKKKNFVALVDIMVTLHKQVPLNGQKVKVD